MRWPALAFAALAFASPASARTWYITPDGTGDAPTIQAGIDSASAGDVVELACGTYFESGLVVEIDLLLRGATGSPDCVTIDAQQDDRHIVATENLRIEGLEFVGGLASTSVPFLAGGSILGHHAASLTLERCRFEGNYAPWRGGALYWQGGPLTVRQCDFVGNSIGFNDLNGSHAGAIYTRYTAVVIEDSGFFGNVAGPGMYNNSSGGAISCYRGYITVSGSRFWDNKTFGNGVGGAIVATGNDFEAVACDFRRNEGSEGGAIHTGVGGFARFRHCSFSENIARAEGAVYAGTAGGCDPTFDGCTLSGNMGGQAVISFRGDLLLVNTIVEGSEDASAVMCHSLNTTLEVVCTDVFGNEGGDWIGCLAPFAGTNGNTSADPLFCEPDANNYYLQWGSPCLPANSGGCGLVGAYGPGGCNSVSVTPETWGRIKSRFR